MSKQILVTTGSTFQDYEIAEYLGVITGQGVLGSNFIKSLTATVSDASEREDKKLEKCREDACEKIEAAAEKLGADAIIGMRLTYASCEGGSYGIIASGTAVKIKKKVCLEKTRHKELVVTNYYLRVVPKPVKVILDGNVREVLMKVQFFNYNLENILAIRANLEFTNLYDERLVIRDIDFTFERGNVSLIEAEATDAKISMNDMLLLKDAKLTINKYATPNGVFAVNDTPVDVTMSAKRLMAFKEKHGIDAVEKYKNDGMIWTCMCGHINEGGSEECQICGRKQSDMRTEVNFNYDDMIRRMRARKSVTEIKDVLMDYIKEIDSKYRLELLEIMESGIQYEKTRGNMTDTVIEKVEKVLEDCLA